MVHALLQRFYLLDAIDYSLIRLALLRVFKDKGTNIYCLTIVVKGPDPTSQLHAILGCCHVCIALFTCSYLLQFTLFVHSLVFVSKDFLFPSMGEQYFFLTFFLLFIFHGSVSFSSASFSWDIFSLRKFLPLFSPFTFSRQTHRDRQTTENSGTVLGFQLLFRLEILGVGMFQNGTF